MSSSVNAFCFAEKFSMRINGKKNWLKFQKLEGKMGRTAKADMFDAKRTYSMK